MMLKTILTILFIIKAVTCFKLYMIEFKDFKDLKFNKPTDIYKDCGSETGEIKNITISGCTKVPCIFVRGNNYTIDLEFSSKVDTNAVVNKVYGIIAKLPVPFPLPNENGCSLGVNCPVKNGDLLSESVTLPVLNEYPKLSLYVKWEALDDKNKKLVCFIFPVTLQ